MYALSGPREPEWRDFEPGIRLQLRFGPSQALTFGRRHLRATLKADDRTDPEFAFVVGILIWAVTAWEGVGPPAPVPPPEIAEGPAEALTAWEAENPAPEGPAPLTADSLTMLLSDRTDIFDALDRTYVEAVLKVRDEKNGSGPSPRGTSAAAGLDTASDVANATSPAPGANPA